MSELTPRNDAAGTPARHTSTTSLPDPSDRFENPGLPPHKPRRSDVNPKAAKRAERQIMALFTLSMLGALGFVVCYFVIPDDLRGWVFGIGEMNIYHLALGLCLTASLLGIGLGAGQWAKTLMTNQLATEDRKPMSSTEEQRRGFAEVMSYGYRSSQLNRRPVLGLAVGGALGLFALPLGLQVVGGLGPLPGNALSITNWRRGMRLMIDPAGTPIRPEHVTQGSVFHIMPEGFVGPEAEHELPATELMTSKSKDSVILVRLNPADIKSTKQRDWGVDGIVAYSKICTHVGCPVALYEQQTHHLLCPCHQSTFDMTDDCNVIFGPAKRPLPQLPIAVDDDGYLVAADGFDEPIGPSFWERGGE
jgi:ubiquinol-cytochrome c reductase iron-sulfur subunit